MQVEVKDIKGKAVKKIDLPDGIFNVEMNENVIHGVVKAYQANRRQGTASAKTRSFVSGGGKKPFKQKGTGQARQGTLRAPHMPGGAIVHGPQPRSHALKINQNTKQLALKIALSDRLRSKKLIVIDDFAIADYSTKHVKGILDSFKTDCALLADERKDNILYKSAANIYKVCALSASELNAENVLRHDTLLISEAAVTTLRQRLEGGRA